MSEKAPRRLIDLGDWALARPPTQHNEATREAATLLLRDLDSGDELTESTEVNTVSENDSDDSGDINDNDNDNDDDDDADDDNDEDSEIDSSSGNDHQSDSKSDKEKSSSEAYISSEQHSASNSASQSLLETKDTWEYHRHRTISQDQTKAGVCDREKLAALQQGLYDSRKSANKIPLASKPPSNHALEDWQVQLMLVEQQRKRRLMMEREENITTSSSRAPERYLTPLISTEDTPIDPGKGESQRDAHHRIEQLGAEIEKLQRQQNSLKSTTKLVLHKIQDDQSSYFDEPSWTLSQGNQFRLAGHSPLADEAKYLRRRPDVGFIVYKHYEHDYQAKAIRKAKTDGSMLPAPEPARETIQLLSEQMISAVDAFISAQPTFEAFFPDWQSNRPIQSPFLFWYHYRSEGCLDALPEPSLSQMRLLTKWIDEKYNDIYAGAEDQFSSGRVSWSTMPFFVRPGDVLVSKSQKGIQGYIAESWATKSGPRRYAQSSQTSEPAKVSQSWSVDAWSYGYDGQFYRHETCLSIQLEFDDDEEIVDMGKLQVLPLQFGGDEFRKKLDYRGRIMWECRRKKLIAYKDRVEDDLSGEGDRYMVDFDTYKKLHSDSYQFQRAYPFLGKPGRKEMGAAVMDCEDAPQGPELLVFPSTIIGYNLRQKKWRHHIGDLEVDLIQEVSWNKQAFKHLVINEEIKDLIQALVTSELETEENTDLIQGKGNGLIMLLHGGPGTGKTFTAESVAELAEKPLFRVTCGDIGTKPEEVEKYLESVLHLGKIWGCVVLLDEADVFLEQRTLQDLERNALVSVFLRVLEYYEGILILTSNRVGTFDEAFKSRIQLSLHYEALDKSQRRMIWSNFLNRLKTLERENTKIEPIEQRKRKFEETKGINFDDIERHLGELAEQEMNGRQIRNSITTARQLAKFKGDNMSYRHLEHVIAVSKKFDSYLQRVRDNYTDDQVAREERIR
ncbi:hypothetical protein FDECE_15783 [Fusarium decemcellulare]|nr:hypothetical protein FDECE_15783 [Fusarium decemcellulare]